MNKYNWIVILAQLQNYSCNFFYFLIGLLNPGFFMIVTTELFAFILKMAAKDGGHNVNKWKFIINE